jgi:hypothetical protein
MSEKISLIYFITALEFIKIISGWCFVVVLQTEMFTKNKNKTKVTTSIVLRTRKVVDPVSKGLEWFDQSSFMADTCHNYACDV